MTVLYDPEEDTLRILLRNAPIHASEVHPAGLVLDFDQDGGILGIEIASASHCVSQGEGLSLIERFASGEHTKFALPPARPASTTL